jgi:hypothetical protein
MKTTSKTLLASLLLATASFSVNLDKVKAETVNLIPNSPLSTIVLQGNSSGNLDSKDCGFMNSNPNHILNIQERIDYMRVTVQGQGGQTTLLIDGPAGRFCALATDNIAEISGFWNPGLYKVFVGDRTGTSHPFTIQFSQ